MAKTTPHPLSHLKPTPGYLLIQPQEAATQTASGIYLPDTATGDKPQQGSILASGPATVVEGREIASPAGVGDQVIYKKWGGNEVKIDNKEYIFVKFEDVLAVVSR